MTIGHALQDVREPGKGLDIVEFCGGDEGADGCPPDGATVGAKDVTNAELFEPVKICSVR